MRRSVKRPRLTAADRLFWAGLSGLWSHWRTALIIVRPETVIAWHRKSFRLFWTWKVRHGSPGRPGVAKDVRDLIRKMSRENPLYVKHALMLNWGRICSPDVICSRFCST
jgi:putative transposase